MNSRIEFTADFDQIGIHGFPSMPPPSSVRQFEATSQPFSAAKERREHKGFLTTSHTKKNQPSRPDATEESGQVNLIPLSPIPLSEFPPALEIPLSGSARPATGKCKSADGDLPPPFCGSRGHEALCNGRGFSWSLLTSAATDEGERHLFPNKIPELFSTPRWLPVGASIFGIV
jgi:hypothetical protein